MPAPRVGFSRHSPPVLLLAFALWLLPAADALSAVPPGVERVLSRAGANRGALEDLLQSYDMDATREKYDALCFLLAGLHNAGKAAPVVRYDERIDSCWEAATRVYLDLTAGCTVRELHDGDLNKRLTDTAAVLHRSLPRFAEPVVEEAGQSAVEAVDSTFLRRVLEHAFAVRERSPWARRLSFSDFCAYVLPYRAIAGYPQVADPVRLDSLFSPVLRADTARSLVEVVARYNHFVNWIRRIGGKYPFKVRSGFAELLFSGAHDCMDVAHYGASVLRAVGVPVAVEFNSGYRLWEGRHYMVSVRMPDGTWHPFSPESNLPVPSSADFSQCLNLFRLHASPCPDSPLALCAEGEHVPQELASLHVEDITADYLPTARVELPVPSRFPAGNRLAYLATFRSGGLQAVTWGEVDSTRRSVAFDRVVGDNLYFPVYCDVLGRLRPFAQPFWLAADSLAGFRMERFPQGGAEKRNALLLRKFPVKSRLAREARSIAGTAVLGSDRRDFAEADTLARIDSVAGPYWADLPLRIGRPYRYYRVDSPASNRHLHLGELQFLTKRDYGYANTIAPTELIASSPLDTARRDTAWVRLLDEPLDECGWKAEYDDNVQTAPDRWPDVTLVLDEPQWVHVLRYAPKSAANTVERGHLYRLNRWDERNGWRTEWIVPARYNFIEAELETGTLYWLKDENEGKEELPFFIDGNGKQVFPHAWWPGGGLEQ